MSMPTNPYEHKNYKDNFALVWDACSKAWAEWVLDKPKNKEHYGGYDIYFTSTDFNALKKLAEEVGNG
jgi:hypothetical protein